MVGQVAYQVWARRKPNDKNAKPRLELFAWYPERLWQRAIKAARTMRDRGFTDVKVVEIETTDVWFPK